MSTGALAIEPVRDAERVARLRAIEAMNTTLSTHDDAVVRALDALRPLRDATISGGLDREAAGHLSAAMIHLSALRACLRAVRINP